MSTDLKCPKCGFASDARVRECTQCGVVVRTFERESAGAKQAQSAEAGRQDSGLQDLAKANTLIIKQQKEWGEILTGFETKNKYEVMDHLNNPLMHAHEEGDSSMMSTITRQFLKALRPFTIRLSSPQGTGLFRLTRPFRFYFHELDVCKSNGAPLGTIKRRFSVLRRIYSVLDRNGNEIFQLFGPLLHPWTFEIRKGDRSLGKITKKWSGLAKESFTDADNFGISFPRRTDLSHKAVLLGAVFLIDFVHFENSGNNRN